MNLYFMPYPVYNYKRKAKVFWVSLGNILPSVMPMHLLKAYILPVQGCIWFHTSIYLNSSFSSMASWHVKCLDQMWTYCWLAIICQYFGHQPLIAKLKSLKFKKKKKTHRSIQEIMKEEEWVNYFYMEGGQDGVSWLQIVDSGYV